MFNNNFIFKMASFRECTFKSEKKHRKLELFKTTAPNLKNANPFQIYKLYNTGTSNDTNRAIETDKFKAIAQNNSSLPVDEDFDSYQPIIVEQEDFEISKGKLLTNGLPFKIQNIEINKENISPKPESISANSRIKSNINQKDHLHGKKYDLIKNNKKIKRNENFMKRMQSDLSNRQSKEERINNKIEQNQDKKHKSELVKIFNRLIEDANRRMKAFDNMDLMKQFLDEKVSFRKYTHDQWDKVYNER
jgi:hypothetical protein